VILLENYEKIKEGLRKISRATAMFSKSFDFPGYTFHEMNILGTIVRNPGMIARDICEYNVMDRGYLSRILRKLESNGLILRTAERRPPFEKILSVTPLGEKAYSKAEQLVDQAIAERLSVMHESEREAFDCCLTATLQYMKKIVPDAPRDHAEEEDSRKNM
jgi:DNA-binding MarR family transcriptional regulator